MDHPVFNPGWITKDPIWYLVSGYFFEGPDVSDGPITIDENIYLVRASDDLTAFERGKNLCLHWEESCNKNAKSESSRIRFFGISEVMPIWEPFEDGCELGFRKAVFENQAEVKERVLSEEEVKQMSRNRDTNQSGKESAVSSDLVSE